MGRLLTSGELKDQLAASPDYTHIASIITESSSDLWLHSAGVCVDYLGNPKMDRFHRVSAHDFAPIVAEDKLLKTSGQSAELFSKLQWMKNLWESFQNSHLKDRYRLVIEADHIHVDQHGSGFYVWTKPPQTAYVDFNYYSGYSGKLLKLDWSGSTFIYPNVEVSLDVD